MTGPFELRTNDRRVPMAMRRRPWTPETRDPDTGVRVLRIKRCCNGCGVTLGDSCESDVDTAGNLTDVRGECPFCSRKETTT